MAHKEALGPHPPKVPLSIRVGVTGHRDVKDGELLRGAVRRVLTEISQFAHTLASGELKDYTEGTPVLSLVSPLAEGADRIVADVARELGFDLRCPLPFTIDEYSEDFETPESKAQFFNLLESAGSKGVLQLDGDPRQRQKAYKAVGHTMLVQSDVVIAIWDGKPEKGEGGTAEIIRAAHSLALPVVWIHARQPDRIELLDQGDSPQSTDLGQLEDRLEAIFGLPKISSQPKEAAALRYFFRETRPKLSLGGFYEFLYSLVRGKPRWPKIVVEDFQKATKKEWSNRIPEEVQEFVAQGFRAHFSWADNLAGYYAGLSRSSVIANYLMGAAVVLTAFVSIQRSNLASTYIELALLTAILLLTWWGRHRRWHERWMDYRTLAESLRLMQFAAPLAQVPPSFRVPVHMERGDPRTSWANWHFRAVVRYAGMVPTIFGGGYLASCRDLLVWFAQDSQATYHKNTAERAHRVHSRMHRLGFGLFALAAAGCIVHLIGHEVKHPAFSFTVGFIVVVIPAFGAAIAAILHHAELERVSFRSHALEARLRKVAADLKARTEIDSLFLGAQFHRIAEIMQAEFVDWRYVFLDKDLVLPS
ncbi:MAG TPA: hypothetical protein VGS22_02910 [Thermoanaerobaculia bacterium]|jgi:hypothetical protein|nr:hypothetical protein [Thermoanaerobaculia bacterium]